MLGQGLDLNLCEVERKGDVFGEVLVLAAQISLQYFCVVSEIL